MQEKSYNQYLAEVTERFSSLSEEEKDALRSLRGTQQGLIMAKILGPDMASADLGKANKPAPLMPNKRGLGTR